MRIADVSIDFDFFVRENPYWDFGHVESRFFLTQAWDIRYTAIDLFTETAYERYADFLPAQLTGQLQSKGYRFDALPKSKRRFGTAESHRHAFKFLRRSPPPDVLLSLDAHHDLWATDVTGPALAQDWLVHLATKWTTTDIHVIYPAWKDMALDGPPSITGPTLHQWAAFPTATEPTAIRHVFLCRSGAWVPPHHDPTVLALGSELYSLSGQYTEMEPMIVRPQPDRDTMTAHREAHAQKMATFLSRVDP